MPNSIKVIITIIVTFMILSIILFVLLVRFYPPLDNFLFGEREFLISLDDIQFWLRKVPKRNYYRVCAKYLNDPQKTEDLEFGHGIYFDIKNGGGWNIVFNPEDNKIYGGGWWKKEVYYLGEGKIEGNAFNPSFHEGTKFTFILPGRISISSAPAYYITIYFPEKFKKLEKEELEKGILAEIVEEETRIKK